MSLFRGQSTGSYGNGAIQTAVRAIERLPKANFEALAAREIEQALRDAVIKTPQLHFEARRGKRVSEEKVVREFGQHVVHKIDYVDVIVPFSGNKTAFQLSPSHQIMNTMGTLNTDGDAIVIRLPDDERLEQQLESAISQISTNLGNFTEDMSALAAEMKQVLSGVVERRKQLFSEQEARDTTRSFPID